MINKTYQQHAIRPEHSLFKSTGRSHFAHARWTAVPKQILTKDLPYVFLNLLYIPLRPCVLTVGHYTTIMIMLHSAQ